MEKKTDNMEMAEFAEKTKVQIEEYLELRTELFKTKYTEKAAKAFSKLVTGVVLMVLCFFMVLFFSMVAGFYFGEVLGSLKHGFMVVASFYLLLFLVIVVFRKALIEIPVINTIISIVYEDEEA